MGKWYEPADSQAIDFQTSPVLPGDQCGNHSVFVQMLLQRLPTPNFLSLVVGQQGHVSGTPPSDDGHGDRLAGFKQHLVFKGEHPHFVERHHAFHFQTHAHNDTFFVDANYFPFHDLARRVGSRRQVLFGQFGHLGG